MADNEQEVKPLVKKLQSFFRNRLVQLQNAVSDTRGTGNLEPPGPRLQRVEVQPIQVPPIPHDRGLVPEERGVIDEEGEHDGFGNLDVSDEEQDDGVSEEEQDDVVPEEEQDDVALESDSEEPIGVHVNNVAEVVEHEPAIVHHAVDRGQVIDPPLVEVPPVVDDPVEESSSVK